MTEAIARSPRPVSAPPPALDLTDIYYTLFRHWRMILLFILLGIASAVAVYLIRGPSYVSEARMLIRFVLDRRTISATEPGTQVSSPGQSGENIMYSEVEILSSQDLALRVADLIGPEKILARVGGGTNLADAAVVIQKCMRIEVPRRSNIIRVSFVHPDPEVVRPVLQQLVDAYLAKHVEIHRNAGVLDDLLRRQRELLSRELSEVEAELTTIRTNLGIVSLEESKRTMADRLTRLAGEIATVETELAEFKASQPEGDRMSLTNAPIMTNWANLPPDKLQEFAALRNDLESMRRRERELLGEYTEQHYAVKRIRLQLAEREKQRDALIAEVPELAALAATLLVASNGASPAMMDLTRASTLQARLTALRSQLEVAHRSAAELVGAESRITELERNKAMQESKLRNYQASLDQVAVDEALGPGKVTNINVVQAPTVPQLDRTSSLKLHLAAFLLPSMLGIALAFVLDKLLKQAVRRPSELERVPNVPLFVSIEDSRKLRSQKALRWTPNDKGLKPVLLAEGPQGGMDTSSKVETLMAVLHEDKSLRQSVEALRDRLVTYFEVNNMTHKPKLVALTACHRAAGVTTVAAGLASVLSETGDGKVLLVDMNETGGAACHFYRGKPELRLVDALENGKRSNAQVQENLYVVAEHDFDGGLPRVLPQRFQHLVPRLRVSDYDYIIFDLPHMSHTSIALRVARFMDVTLLVTEADRTPRQVLRQSARILVESGAQVATVLNRTHPCIPAGLRQELS